MGRAFGGVVLFTINLVIALHNGYVLGSTAAELVITVFRLLLHASYVLLLIACVVFLRLISSQHPR